MKNYSIKDIVPELRQSVQYYAGVFENAPDPDVEWPHRHAFYSLVWFTEGSGANMIDFDEYQIAPNRIFAVNPKQIHHWNYSINCKGYFLLIEEHLARHLQLDFSFPYADISADDLALIKELTASVRPNCITIIWLTICTFDTLNIFNRFNG